MVAHNLKPLIGSANGGLPACNAKGASSVRERLYEFGDDYPDQRDAGH